MKEKDKETVCAVVVTYNRKNLLLECLEALRKQTRPIQGIYLIDNASTDGTPELLLEKGYIKELPPQELNEPWEREFEIKNLKEETIKFYYVRMHENTGGAGGFYEGVKRAYEKGYDWLWLMDDDVEPVYDSLYNLINILKNINNSKISALMPVRFYKNKLVNLETKTFNFRNLFSYFTLNRIKEEDLKQSFFEVAAIPFEGPLINTQAIKKIGYPNKDFFIFCDDTDYAIRLLEYGKILMIPSSRLIKKLLNESHDFNWKSYYLIRNIIFLERTYGKNFIVRYIRPLFTFLRFIKRYRKDFFSTKSKYMITAFIRGYMKKLGVDIRQGDL